MLLADGPQLVYAIGSLVVVVVFVVVLVLRGGVRTEAVASRQIA